VIKELLQLLDSVFLYYCSSSYNFEWYIFQNVEFECDVKSIALIIYDFVKFVVILSPGNVVWLISPGSQLTDSRLHFSLHTPHFHQHLKHISVNSETYRAIYIDHFVLSNQLVLTSQSRVAFWLFSIEKTTFRNVSFGDVFMTIILISRYIYQNSLLWSFCKGSA
jgi:hypothetical protein